MPNTAINQLPYPALTDTPHAPSQMGALANAIDSRLVGRFANAAARDTAIPAPINGMVIWLDNPGVYQERFNSVWHNRYPEATAWTNITVSAPWTQFTGSGGTVFTGPYEPVSWRREGPRIFLRGWFRNASSTVDANTPLGPAVPVAARPAKGRPIWLNAEFGNQVSIARWEMFTNGILYSRLGAAVVDTYFCFDGTHYDIT